MVSKKRRGADPLEGMTFSWRKGSRFTTDPRAAYVELERIRKKYGSLQPKFIVEESKPDDSVFNKEFPWDKDRAAQMLWEQTARRLCNHLMMTIEEAPASPVRALQSIEVYDGDASFRSHLEYQKTTVALRDPPTRDQILARVIRDLVRIRNEWSHLSELIEVFAAIDALAMDAAKAQSDKRLARKRRR